MNRAILSGTAALAMLLSCAAPAWAAPDHAPARSETTADVDGDGRGDPVTLQQVSEETMLLRAGLRDEFVDATVAGDARGQRPVPADIDGDGADELLVPESVGANTITYAAWTYTPEAGLHAVRTTDGEPLRLHEGGGATAVSTYGCAPANTGRLLVSVNAHESGPEAAYQGDRVTYSVRGGVAAVVDETPIADAERDDPALRADPATCAPLP